jgi:hypothetical protein
MIFLKPLYLVFIFVNTHLVTYFPTRAYSTFAIKAKPDTYFDIFFKIEDLLNIHACPLICQLFIRSQCHVIAFGGG